MLRLNKIELEDFGPFKNEQLIELPDDPGVSIVFGENMRGKTTLLNAIRYALFGKILGRGSRKISPEQFINWESKEEGKYSFKVALFFEGEEAEYELVRQFSPKDTVAEPQEDDDYTEEVYLVKDGSVLGPDERDQELARVLPEQVSRFFLFDGELLQQYEELLIDESDMGRNIRRAIERILGVPVLTNGRADLRDLLNDAQKQETKAAQQSEMTQQLGTQLESATEKRDHLQGELEDLENQLEALQDEKAAKREQLDQLEAISGLVDEKEILKDKIEDIDEQLENQQEKLRDLMEESWHGILQDTIQERLESLQEKRIELEEQRTRISVAKELASKIDEGLEDDKCPICLQDINRGSEKHLQEERDTLQKVTESDADPEEEYDRIVRAIDVLKSLSKPSPKDRIGNVISRTDGLKAERATKKDRINEIDSALNASQEEQVSQLNKEYEEIIGKIQIKKQVISDTENELGKTKQNIKKLQDKLDDTSGDELELERERRQLYDDLVELFDDGVGKYRDELRQRVENDASDIFLELTTEPEYDRLKINDNYGLTIVHEDGDEITIRSAGAEHVVALALMGALQNNAPLQGPIIMDSPFGRLDGGHVRNIVETLPSLTEQVILLVYRDELDPGIARELLKGKLRKEYTMERESARHTELVPGGKGQ